MNYCLLGCCKLLLKSGEQQVSSNLLLGIEQWSGSLFTLSFSPTHYILICCNHLYTSPEAVLKDLNEYKRTFTTLTTKNGLANDMY